MGPRVLVPSLISVLFVVAAPAPADTLVSIEVVAEAMPEWRQPERRETQQIWFGKGTLRHDKGTVTSLLDAREDRLYLVKHDVREYHAIDLPVDYVSLFGRELRQQVLERQEKFALDLEVKETQESRVIAGYAARLVQVFMSNPVGMRQEIDMWMSSEPPVDLPMFKNYLLTVVEFGPSGSEWVEQLSKIEGFPVLKETRSFTDGRVYTKTETVVSVSVDAPPPDGGYAPPAGYTLTPFGVPVRRTPLDPAKQP